MTLFDYGNNLFRLLDHVIFYNIRHLFVLGLQYAIDSLTEKCDNEVCMQFILGEMDFYNHKPIQRIIYISTQLRIVPIKEILACSDSL